MKPKPCVLLVEDDVERGRAMARAFSKRFECLHLSTIGDVPAALREDHWGAVIANCGLANGCTGVEVLQAAQETLPRAFRIVYSEGHSESFRRDAQRIVQSHFTTDAAQPDFIGVLERTLGTLLEPPLLEIPPDLPAIQTDVWIGRAPMTREFLSALRVAAETDGPVYIYGEPGAGKTRAGITLCQWRREWKARGSPGAIASGGAVSILRVPSLRERPQDLPVLAARCLVGHGNEIGEVPRRLCPRATEELLGRDWFGNVVELHGVLMRAVLRVGPRQVIEAVDLPQDRSPAWRPSQYAKDAGQRDCLLRQLRAAGTVSCAARLEGCSRSNYIRLMRRLGIMRADVVADPALEGAEAFTEAG